MFGQGTRTGTVNSITAGVWHHVVVAFYGGAGNVEIYVDGVSQALAHHTGDPFNLPRSFGGTYAIGAAVSGADRMSGMIDEYAIYSLDGFGEQGEKAAHVADIALHFSQVPEPGAPVLCGLAVLVSLAGRRRSRG